MATRLRVLGGEARGTPIAEPRGLRLRPTSGKVREAIFNILGSDVEGARVLDLYAGTGALGIEALSRGAEHAVFVEADSRGCRAILESLARAKLTAAAEVLRGKLPAALDSLEGTFHLVFIDPPYHDERAVETLIAVSTHLAPGGMVVYEHASRYNPPERPFGLVLTDRRVYGDTAVGFYARQEEE